MDSLPKWFSGRSIFVTGGTGFMGKVLLEKMLRALPDLNKVYVLIRPKRGQSAQERLMAITKLPVFDKLREINPLAFDKLVAVEGDITKENLSISDENIEILAENVSVVLHGAATLKLECTIKEAIIQNTLGTKWLLELCLKFKNIESVVHLSTAFCHGDVKVLEEKIYPPTLDMQEVFKMVTLLSEEEIERYREDILGIHPNAYTLSKRLAETVAYDMGNKLPLTIIRPSIVIPAFLEPIPGWVDTLNGPVGVLVGAGKGVIRTMLVNRDNHAEVVPVDIAANVIIMAAWHRVAKSVDKTPVLNLTQSDVLSITWGEILEKGRSIIYDLPFEWTVWYPDGNIRMNRFVHSLLVVLVHTIPAYFIDFLLLIFWQKRFMVRVQKRISLGLELLQYFTLREWKFKNTKFLELFNDASNEDQNVFYSTNMDFHVDVYLATCLLGAKKFLLKEKLSSIPRLRKNISLLYCVDKLCKYLVYTCIGFYLSYMIRIQHFLSSRSDNFALRGITTSG